MKYNKKRKKHIIQNIIYILFPVCLLIGIIHSSNYIAAKTANETEKTLVEAITRASIQCYAIEGRYPPDVEYIEKNYGIVINHSEYNVFYEGFASNIKPDITVVRSSEKEK